MHCLLEKAIDQLKIISSSAGEDLSVEKYKNILLESGRGRSFSEYEIQIMDEKIRLALDALLRESFNKYKTSNDHIICGTFHVIGGPMSYMYDNFIERYTRSLINLSITHGSHIAAEKFYACAQNEKIYFSDVLAFDYITIDKNHKIFDGVHFINYHEKYSPEIKFPSGNFENIELAPTTAIINRGYITKFFFDENDSDNLEQCMRFETENFDPLVFCQILSLVCLHMIFPRYRWHTLDRDQVMREGSRSMEGYKGIHLPCDISIFKLEKAKKLFLLLQKKESLYNSLTMPISRLIASMGDAKTLQNAIIDLAIALECLYAPKNNRNISYQLSIHAALHMGKTFEERKKIRDDMRKIYRLRSKAVHEGTLGINASNHKDFYSTFERSKKMCSKAIIKIIQEGPPDFDDLVLGGE